MGEPCFHILHHQRHVITYWGGKNTILIKFHVPGMMMTTAKCSLDLTLF